jgi:hypothetical protein
VRNPTVAFLVARGTRFTATLQGVKETLADFNAAQVPWGVGRAHEGFARIVRAAWPEMGPFLAARHGENGSASDVPLYLVGHSMGAAAVGLTMACAIGADQLGENGCTEATASTSAESDHPYIRIAALYAFGMPRAADSTLAQWIGQQADERRIFVARFVYGGQMIS